MKATLTAMCSASDLERDEIEEEGATLLVKSKRKMHSFVYLGGHKARDSTSRAFYDRASR